MTKNENVKHFFVKSPKIVRPAVSTQPEHYKERPSEVWTAFPVIRFPAGFI
jgi:hypothetical protein